MSYNKNQQEKILGKQIL